MADWQSTGTRLPIDLHDYGYASYNGKIYFIGGSYVDGAGSGHAVSTVYIYDINTNTISNGTNLPLALSRTDCLAYNGKIYCAGGRTESSGYFYRLLIYDISANQWSQSTAALTTSIGIGVAAYAGNIYLVGGTTPTVWSTSIYSFNESNPNIINRLSVSLQSARGYVGCVCHNNALYCIGGYTGGSSFLSALDILDLSTMSWSNGPSSIYPRSVADPALYGSDIYCMGNVNALSPVEAYSMDGGNWRFVINPPSGILHAGGTALESDRLFLLPDSGSFTTPYIFFLDLRTASITNANPTAGFINEKTANIFSWTLESNPAGTAQLSGTFQWRSRGASTINTINTFSAQSVTIPANTFPNGEIEWRVSAANTAGVAAPFSEWFLLTTIDERPNKPTGLYPNSGSRDGTKVVQFSWLHNSPLSTPQSAFELQISYDGGYSWRALSSKVATAVTQFTAAANTILPTDTTGRVGWRVRTYNSDNVASDWSNTAFFIVHPAPQVPNWISVETGKSRPLCRWTSIGQVGYQLQVTSGEAIIFDSGEIHGTETEYRISEFLNNGVFTFRVRIKNIRGLFSEWANRSVSINAPHRLNITLQGEVIENGAQLTFDVEVRASG